MGSLHRLSLIPAIFLFPGHLAADSFFIRGDVDGNARLDLSDPVGLLGYLFLGREEPGCLDAGDSNDDGALDLSDALYTLFSLFLGGSPPAPPFPGCGGDPTPDDLGCDVFSRCLSGSETNQVAGIRTVADGIEIEVFSLHEFPARALFPILCVGDQSFPISRSPEDGSLNTLIFSLTAGEFAAARTGDSLTVQYGYCEPDYEDRWLYWDLWVFGVLDKSLLDREENP